MLTLFISHSPRAKKGGLQGRVDASNIDNERGNSGLRLLGMHITDGLCALRAIVLALRGRDMAIGLLGVAIQGWR